MTADIAAAVTSTGSAGLSGLSAREAAVRLDTDGSNELPASQPRTLAAVAIDVVREPMLLLLIAIGIVYVLLGDLQEAIAMLAAIAVVIAISIYQAQKTERTLQALRDLSSPRALVVRDGRHVRIAGRDVVCGDLIILREGDRVAADGVVTSGANLAADESLLTGESIAVRKTAAEDAVQTTAPGGDDRPFVYSGTLIVRGTGVARVTATGVRTELGKIGASLARLEPGRTALQSEVDRLVAVMATAGLIVCAVVTFASVAHRATWLDGVLAGLTAAIAMVPEEFPVVLTIFLALGAWRISRSQVLTRRVPAIEQLGAATVLCVDKTGTLTLNRMAVTAMAAGEDHFDIPADLRELPAPCLPVIEAAVLASRPDPFDPMERAFGELARRVGLQVPHAGWQLVREYPLSDRVLAVTQAWRDPGSEPYVVSTKGAPETIAHLCGLDDARRHAVAKGVAAMAARGLRVLGVARCRYVAAALPDSPLGFRFTWLGLVGLSDPVRPGVPEAIEECHAGGIRVVMITGDHAATALTIAQEIGLALDGAHLTGAEIAAMSDDDLCRRVANVEVFARIVPEQKLRLVTALQARGEVVAMTGDGVNDAPALKAAHIGIAMGKRGTDVAREAAALVLLDDDFSSIVRAIRVGRRIYDNIAKAMLYVLAIHVPIALVSMVPVLAGGPMVLLPLHIVLIELIVDPACSIAFEMEPADSDVMHRPPRRAGQRLFTRRYVVRAVGQGASAALVALIVYFAALRAGHGELDVRTLTFATLVVTNLCLILTSRTLTRSIVSTLRTPNPALWLLTGGTLVTLTLVIGTPPLRDLFRLAPAHVDDGSAIVAAGVVALALMEAIKWSLHRSSVQ